MDEDGEAMMSTRTEPGRTTDMSTDTPTDPSTDMPTDAPTDATAGAARGEPPLHIHRVRAADWASHRDLRLAMLTADPDAFWADLDEARARTEQQWREEAAGPRVHLQARRGDEVVGGIALLPAGYTPQHPIPEDCAHIVSLWVRPEARRNGVSRPLFGALARLALDLGRPDLRLDVDESNLAAQRLYERIGFEPTGARDPREGRSTAWVEYAIRAERLLEN
jgi:ribosomal protein S18 acetylase RimI-like enzyme